MCPMYMQIDNAAATVIKECLVEDLTTETILYILHLIITTDFPLLQ